MNTPLTINGLFVVIIAVSCSIIYSPSFFLSDMAWVGWLAFAIGITGRD